MTNVVGMNAIASLDDAGVTVRQMQFAALKAEIVRRVVGAGAPLLQPGDSLLVSRDGRRDSASLRAVHGTHLLIRLEDGTDRWVERDEVTRA